MAATTLSADPRDPRPAGPRATSPTCCTATPRRSTASTIAGLRCAAGRRPVGAVRQRRAARRRRRGRRAGSARRSPTVVWQHHLLSVYHVEVDGDRASALVYHTSHQVFEDDPDTAKLLVGRYHNELRREAGGWRISRLVLELLWGEDEDRRRRLPRPRRWPRPGSCRRMSAPIARRRAVRPRAPDAAQPARRHGPRRGRSSRTACRCPRTPSTGAGRRPAARRC